MDLNCNNESCDEEPQQRKNYGDGQHGLTDCDAALRLLVGNGQTLEARWTVANEGDGVLPSGQTIEVY